MSASHIIDARSTAEPFGLKKVVVFGASGHAKVILDILLKAAIFSVVGLLDEYKPPGYSFAGQTVLGTSSDLPRLTDEYAGLGVVMAIGDNWIRDRVVRALVALGPDTDFVSAIHPSAQIASDVTVERGTVIMAGAVLNPGVRVGEFCIVNTRASLDHDSTMGAFSSLAPGAITGGNVAVGSYSNVGMGATVLPGVSIGQHTLIGAGALVYRSVPDNSVAYGVPARLIRSRQPGDRYLRELGTTRY